MHESYSMASQEINILALPWFEFTLAEFYKLNSVTCHLPSMQAFLFAGTASFEAEACIAKGEHYKGFGD